MGKKVGVSVSIVGAATRVGLADELGNVEGESDEVGCVLGGSL